MVKMWNKQQKQTYKEALAMLKKTGKCVIVRPTGFGKTFLLAHIGSKYGRNGKKVLYLYPIEAIQLDVQNKYSDILTSDKVDFMTYTKFGELGKTKDIEEVINGNYDLIIFDELHCAGSRLRRQSCERLSKHFNEHGIHIIGASGTPDRMDGYDVVHHIFEDNVVSGYGLHEAIQDKLLPKLYYVFNTYEIAQVIKNKIKGIKDKALQNRLNHELRSLEVELGNIGGTSGMLKKHITAVHGKKIDYMKFICFYSMRDTLLRKRGEIVKSFEEAFPKMEVRTLTIMSDSLHVNNIKRLGEFMREKGKIDLIFCVDMLNMGYHVDDITGIILMRGTKSSTIYAQQVGRSLSVTSKKSPIIFDFANNLNQEYFFNTAVAEKVEDIHNVNKVQTRVTQSRTAGIQVMDLILNDDRAKYDKLIAKIENEISDDVKCNILDLWDYGAAPIKVIQAKTGVAYRKIFAYLQDAGRIDANGKELVGVV